MLTVDEMYSPHKWVKLPQQVQTLLSQKRKTCSAIFIALWKSTKNFAHFKRKDWLYSLNDSEVIDHNKCGYFNARKPLF